MTKEELITKQQLEIEEYKIAAKENNETIKELKGQFIGIGQPLNDNVLRFNGYQLQWCYRVLELIESLNTKQISHDNSNR